MNLLEVDFSGTWDGVKGSLTTADTHQLFRLLAWAGVIYLIARSIQWVYCRARGRPGPKGIGWAFLLAVVAIIPIASVTFLMGWLDALANFLGSALAPLAPK